MPSSTQRPFVLVQLRYPPPPPILFFPSGSFGPAPVSGGGPLAVKFCNPYSPLRSAPNRAFPFADFTPRTGRRRSPSGRAGRGRPGAAPGPAGHYSGGFRVGRSSFVCYGLPPIIWQSLFRFYCPRFDVPPLLCADLPTNEGLLGLRGRTTPEAAWQDAHDPSFLDGRPGCPGQGPRPRQNSSPALPWPIRVSLPSPGRRPSTTPANAWGKTRQTEGRFPPSNCVQFGRG